MFSHDMIDPLHYFVFDLVRVHLPSCCTPFIVVLLIIPHHR